MKNKQTRSLRLLRGLLLGAALAGSTIAFAALTDLSNAPLTNGGSIQVKPNIMLLLDTSNSMRRTHMPDELETTSATLSLGYKSYECNILYYSPTQTYQIPKQADGTAFATPSFSAARYNGFDSSSTLVDLGAAFQAYDNSTRQNAVGADTAQPAYYYLHSSGQLFTPNAAPCTDVDTNVSKAATTSASGVSGTWTRKLVNSTSGPGATDERQNFAIWYSFYRTRINLAKSAISLAFTPLTDSYRVGFITVLPNTALDGTGSVNSSYYLPIGDFNTVHRANWFTKLFSQTPRGSSPARQGLARVGRHYAGQIDGINDGMPEDPIQYSCQQNFTIATTDGYWNVGAETVGPVKIDGTTQVGQQDGTLTDASGNTPRPIWDGEINNTRIVTDKNNVYSYAPCTSTWFLRSTSQLNRSTSQTMRSTTQIVQSTNQNLQTSVQIMQSTVQNRQSTTQTTQSTSQNLASTIQRLRSTNQNLQSTQQTRRSTTQDLQTTTQIRVTSAQVTQSTSQAIRRETRRYKRIDQIQQTSSQVTRSTAQTLQSTVQNRQSTNQNLQSTSQELLTRVQITQSTAQITQSTTQVRQSTTQPRMTSAQTVRDTSQNLRSTVQNLQSTTQDLRSTVQNLQTQTQVRQSTSQILSCSSITEICTPVASCTPSGSISCQTVTSGPTLVASCTPATANAGNTYTTTTCASTVTGPTAVQTCTPAAATSGNSFTTTTCSNNNTSNVPVQTCTAASATSGNSWTTTTCSTNNTSNVAVQTCTPTSESSGNNWTATTCSTNNTSNVAVQTCTASTATSGNSWTTTTCSVATTTGGVQTCTAASATSGNSWVTTTCSNPASTNFTNQPASSCTAQTGTSGNNWITISCPAAVTTGPTAVQTCTPSAGTSGNSWVTTTCTPNNTGPTGVSSCTSVAPTSGNSWTTTSCGNNNTGPTGVASCTASAASSGNSWVATTCGNNNVTNSPVQTCTAQTGNAGNAYATITCSVATTGPTAVQTCTPVAESSGNNWTTTTCSTNPTGPTPVSSCSPITATSGNSWTTTTCSTNNTTNVAVQTCTASSATSGNSWTTTTCTPNNSGPTPVSSCAASAATSGNSWVTTTCANPPATNFSNQPAASCTNQAGASGNNWITISCNSVVIMAPTVVDPGTCAVGTTLGGSPNFYSTQCYDTVTDVPSGTCTATAATAGNGWVAISCPGPITTGPTPVQTCTAQTGAAGNNWVTITCANPPATNFANQPAASCTAQTAAAGNNWITITCPAPVVTGPTPVQTCTAVAASSGNAFTATTCSVATTGPTGVDPLTCLLGLGRSSVTVPGTLLNNWVDVTCTANDTTNVPVSSCTVTAASSGNSWVATSCPAPVVTTNVPVASCTASAASSGNSWTTTTCPTPVTSGPTPVQTCSAVAPASGNNFVETTCSVNTTGPTGVASCSPITATSGNSWTTTTCGTNNTTNVAVASCTPTSPVAGNGYTTTTCPAPVTTGPTAVATCTPQTAASGNSWITRTCDTSNANNYANRPVATCTTQAAASGNSFIALTCPAAVVTTNVPVAACSPASASSSNSFTTTTCNTLTTGPTAVAPASCVAQAASSANSFIATGCNLVTSGPTPVASCTAASPVSGNSFVTTTCDTVTTGPSLTQMCTAATASAGNSYTTTTCPLAPGQKIQYTTTTSVTTTQFSGGLAVGAPAVASSTGTATDVDTACYISGVDSLPPFPNPGKPGTTWMNGMGTNVTLAPAPSAPCTSWACTSNSNALAGGVSNSLADVAQYYYVTDLRPSLQNNVPATGNGPEDDRATHQHMTTFTIGLGVSGALSYRNDYRSLSTTTGDFADIRTGVKNWTYPEADQPTSIDDFWHAAVNGRGQYFSAGSPTSVIQGLASALAGVTARTGSGSAAAPSSQAPSDGDNLTYIAKYVTQKWTGELEAREIDLTTGGPKNVVVWSAAAKLATKVGNFCDNRKIYLYRSGATNNLVNFTYNTKACDSTSAPTGAANTGLNATELAFFDSTRASLMSQYLSMTDGTSGTVDQKSAAPGENLVNFIRGQRGNEDFTANTANRLYRKRETILGDITNSAPRYVRGATADYADAGYETFASTSASRTPMVYVASNGGMLHAFRAGTSATDTNGGNEEWAFIPTQALPSLYRLADNNYANNHVYSVDGTPVPSDVYDTTASAWKKILVAGLNGGGKGYYALDVSSPLAPKALWEFNWSNTCYDGTSATSGADCYLGYTYSKPIFGKLNDGTWVVMVTSGYNNVNSPAKAGDGQGYLYVLNAMTGRIIYRIGTGYGDGTTPSGLGQLALFADDPKVSLTALQVYGADLQGNVWRFDVNDRISPSGREAALVGVAKAPDGTRQPIMTTPRLLEQDGKAFIVVGTGRLLGTSDLTDNQVQSVYAFVDNLGSSITNLRSVLAPLIQTQVGANDDAAGYRTIACSSSSTLCATPNGWYSDFPASGERLVVDPQVQLGTLQMATSIMSSSACNVGGIGKLINLNALTGEAIPGQNGQVSRSYLSSLPVGITVLKLPSGGIVSVVADATGANNPFPFPVVQPGPQGKRITWRELVQ